MKCAILATETEEQWRRADIKQVILADIFKLQIEYHHLWIILGYLNGHEFPASCTAALC
jgi:hypothetical protein